MSATRLFSSTRRATPKIFGGAGIIFNFNLATVCWSIVLPTLLSTTVISYSATTNYFTGFDASEGFSLGALDAQNGWICAMASTNGSIRAGAIANGVTSGYLSGSGQQAYVGRMAMPSGYETLFAWQPINLDPIPPTTTVVKFSASMEIVDSTDGQYNDFFWEVYNTQGDLLLNLDFDNYGLEIYYLLSGSDTFEDTGVEFSNGTIYTLGITMDFTGNTWSATLNGTPLVGPFPLAAAGMPRNLGDVDADFDIYFNDFVAGNNFMVFDNFQIISEQRPALSVLGAHPGAPTTVRLNGENGNRYAIDSSTNLANWLPLGTNTAVSGHFDLVDSAAASLNKRFYRGRWLP